MTTDEARAALLDRLRTLSDLHYADALTAGRARLAIDGLETDADVLIAAVRAEGRDPYASLTEHRQQERAGTHLQDTTDCYFCQCAESAETMAALRAALDETQRMLEYLWTATGSRAPDMPVCDLFNDDDPLVQDVPTVLGRARMRLAATPAEEERT